MNMDVSIFRMHNLLEKSINHIILWVDVNENQRILIWTIGL